MTSDLSLYTIRLASAEQKVEHMRAAYVHWGMGYKWEDFLEDMNQGKRSGDWMTDGGLQVWVLVKRDDPEGLLYSGCETFRRKALSGGAGEVLDAVTYGIASVVTPSRFTRNGYATRLLQLLNFQLASPAHLPPFPTTWGAPPPPLSADNRAQIPFAISSTIYSDVGGSFYERATVGLVQPGWVVERQQCQQIKWKLSPPTTPLSPPPARSWLYTKDLPAVADELSAAKREELSAQLGSSWCTDPSSPGLLSYVPSRTLRPRSEDWNQVFDSEPVGLRISAGPHDAGDTIVLFANSMGKISRGLLVTYVHNLRPEQLPTLLLALDEAGAMAGVNEGIVWGILPESELGRAWVRQEGRGAVASTRPERDGHLLGVAWYGDGGKPEEQAVLADSQLYSWC